MELYLYHRETGMLINKLEHVLSYTDRRVVTAEGVYEPLDEAVELSTLPDCSEALRKAWQQLYPSAETRLDELELLMAQLLFGGDDL